MRLLNRTYKNSDRATDVLSFPVASNKVQNPLTAELHDDLRELVHAPYLDTNSGKLLTATPERRSLLPRELGHVFISAERCARDAMRQQIQLDDVIIVVATHGIAHLVGYMHNTGRNYQAMKSAEEAALEAVRSEDSRSAQCPPMYSAENLRNMPSSYLL